MQPGQAYSVNNKKKKRKPHPGIQIGKDERKSLSRGLRGKAC